MNLAGRTFHAAHDKTEFQQWRSILEVDGIAEADDAGANDGDVRSALEFRLIVGVE